MGENDFAIALQERGTLFADLRNKVQYRAALVRIHVSDKARSRSFLKGGST